MLTLLGGELQHAGIVVRTNLGADLPRICGDRVQLHQVLVNLIMNGIDALRPISGRPREMTVCSECDARGVQVQVQDSGSGLMPHVMDLMFQPFFTTKPQGIGMGLSIARSIVESHGGSLWAETCSPHGAIFQFTLPREGAA